MIVSSKLHGLHDGFSIMEVMVALLLLAIGAMGYMAMALTSSQMTTTTFAYSQATNLAGDMVERININYPSIATSNYQITAAPNYALAPSSYPNACELKVCNGVAMASYDLGQVAYEANELLPQGLVAVLIPATGNNHVEVLVSWSGTTPTVGRGPNDCVSSTVSTTGTPTYTYNTNAHCVMLESTYQ